MEKKHDIWSTLAGAIPGVLLIILELTGSLPDPWGTYLTGAGLIVLGILTNNWKRFLEFAPRVLEQIVEQFTGAKKPEDDDPDEDELDKSFGAEPRRGH